VADPYRGGVAAMHSRRRRGWGLLACLVGGCVALTLLAAERGRWGVAFMFGLLPLSFVIGTLNKWMRGTLLDRPVSALWRRQKAPIGVRNTPSD
jgi:hypothetical protein